MGLSNSKQSKTHVNQLPSELLLNIFLYLTPDEWLNVIPKVCLKWKLTVTRHWKQLHELECYCYTDDPFVFCQFKRCNFFMSKLTAKRVRRLFCGLLSCSDIRQNIGHSLTILKISSCPEDLDEKMLQSFGMSLIKLKFLHISGTAEAIIPILKMIAESELRSLKEIYVSDLCDKYSYIGNRLPSADDVNPVEMYYSLMRVLSVYKNLTRFCVDLFYYKAPPLALFSKLMLQHNLEKLEWKVTNSVTITYVCKILSALQNVGPKLKKFSILARIGDDPPNNEEDEEVNSCRSVMTELINKTLITDFDIDIMSHEDQLTLNDFSIPLSNSNCLEYLSVNNFDLSIDRVMENFQNCVKRLFELKLDFSNIDDNLLLTWRVKMPNLTWLTIKLNDKTKISPEMLSIFLFLFCPLLKFVKINYDSKLDMNEYCTNFITSIHKKLHISGQNLLQKFRIELSNNLNSDGISKLEKLCGLVIYQGYCYDCFTFDGCAGICA